jgi:hypothetical protein
MASRQPRISRRKILSGEFPGVCHNCEPRTANYECERECEAHDCQEEERGQEQDR